MVMTIVFVGLLFIVMGVLTMRYPSIIKNWRQANEEERKNIDIKGLQLISCQSLLISGTAIIIVGIINYFIKGSWSMYALLIITFAMAGYITARFRRYDKNPKARKKQTIAASVLAVSLFIIVGMFICGKMEPQMNAVDEKIVINGIYGEVVDFAEIDTVYMSSLKELPKIELKSNGFADGTILKGYFKMQEWGKCKLFVHSIDDPVIVIKYSGKYLIMNFYETEDTENFYNEIQNF